MRRFNILCEWDEAARVWYVSDSNVPGLTGEAPTVEAMQALLLERVPELIRLNLPELSLSAPGAEVPFELLYKQQNSVRLPS